jgi:hypothetical protein
VPRIPLVLAVFVTGCSGPASTAVSQLDASDDVGVEAGPNVPPPRPVAPVSVSYLTSRRPTFRWSLPAGADGALVEVCADRACTRAVTSFTASGDQGAPPEDLPTGVAFWHLRGTASGAVGAASSVTWELVVPPVSAVVSTAWGAMLDANGDGFGDVVVGDSFTFTATQHVYVHNGGRKGPSASPSSVLSAPAPVVRFAAGVASAGDVDGDGFADLLVGSPHENVVYFYRGGPAGFTDPAATVLAGPAQSGFGTSVSGAGDIDGDGYADVVVGLPQQTSPGSPVQGGALVYYGGPDGLSPSRSATLAPREGSNAQEFGLSVSAAGDVDGDGLADVAVWGGIETTDPQYVLVYLGRDKPFGAAPSVLLQYDGTDPSWLDNSNVLACGGDVNGDGYADVVVSTPVKPGTGYTNDHVSIFFGGPGGPSLVPSRRLDSPLAVSDHFGLSLAGIDLNQDGLSDLAVTAVSYAQPPFAAEVYLGAPSSPVLAVTMTTLDATTLFEREVGSPGDVDGDGFPDLVVGFPSRTTTVAATGKGDASIGDGGPVTLHGAVEVHAGSAQGVGATAKWTLFPPDGTTVDYGATLARP